MKFSQKILRIGGGGKWHFLGDHFDFFFFFSKKNCFILLKRPKAFIWGIIFFCTMDGFFRILEKTSSELICTRLYFRFLIWKMLTIRLKLNVKQSQNVSNFPLCMMRYAEDHVDFIQSFLAYLVCITAWILIKPQKIIVDIFTELLGFICAGELLTAYI